MDTSLPLPVATAVKYEGRSYLIDKETDEEYALIGYGESVGFGIAWVQKKDLEFVSGPTENSWETLYDERERRENGEEEE